MLPTPEHVVGSPKLRLRADMSWLRQSGLSPLYKVDFISPGSLSQFFPIRNTIQMSKCECPGESSCGDDEHFSALTCC